MVDLTRHTDEELHSLMDSVTSEMARRASVNAKRRALVRRLETIAESEGVTLDEVRRYLRGDERVPVATVSDEPLPGLSSNSKPEVEKPAVKELSLDLQFESLLQRELSDSV